MLDLAHDGVANAENAHCSVAPGNAEHAPGTLQYRQFLITRLVPVNFVVEMHGGTTEEAAAEAMNLVEKGQYNARIDWDRMSPATVVGVYSQGEVGRVPERVPRVSRRAERLISYFGTVLGLAR